MNAVTHEDNEAEVGLTRCCSVLGNGASTACAVRACSDDPPQGHITGVCSRKQPLRNIPGNQVVFGLACVLTLRRRVNTLER